MTFRPLYLEALTRLEWFQKCSRGKPPIHSKFDASLAAFNYFGRLFSWYLVAVLDLSIQTLLLLASHSFCFTLFFLKWTHLQIGRPLKIADTQLGTKPGIS